jgi:glutathione S-transferase
MMLIQTIDSWGSVIAVIASTLCALQFGQTIKSTFWYSRKVGDDVPEQSQNENDYKLPVNVFVFTGPAISVSGSQFSTKIVSYLRLAGIPHKVLEANFDEAPKSKVPYIKHGGAFFGDSELIIRYLENTYDVSKMAEAASKDLGLSAPFVPFYKLSEENQAMSDLIRLTCESKIYWAIVSVRWGGTLGISKSEDSWAHTRRLYFEAMPSFIRGPITAMIRASFLRGADAQGLLRHSPKDQLYLASRAIRSLSTLLGDKTYFLGDFPAECDCIAFAALDCCMDDSHWPNPMTDFVRNECPNLVEYAARLRKQLYPDLEVHDKLPPSRLSGEPLPRIREG